MMRFANRQEAGRLLAAALMPWTGKKPLVLALPRGGVPVGYEVARALGGTLDVLLVRKIGVPGNPEFGVGAVVEGDPPHAVLDDATIQRLHIPRTWLAAEIARQEVELERRRQAYAGTRQAPHDDRPIILVDDGIATGGTMRAALSAVADTPGGVTIAVPVAPVEEVAVLSERFRVVCLEPAEYLGAVGAFYDDFSQTTDEEVIRLLAKSRGFEESAP
ncbi:MAG TPA: phosphoribosyltransferase family protein [Acetobacteraceae bacterium]|nr:phosphoribosyltransferase family protein [Acetobacteraceae bacterium]